MKEAEQKVAIERLELVLALDLVDQPHAVAQVVDVAVEEALFLNEVHEHQAVEHEGRVPFEIGGRLDALDELEEGSVLGLEAVVELLRDLIYVECRLGLAGHLRQGDSFFLRHAHGDLIEPLDQRVARLRGVVAVIAAGQRLAGLAAHPLPNLLAGGLIGVDNKMLAGGLGDLVVDLEAHGAVGD